MDARLEDYLRSCSMELSDICFQLFKNKSTTDISRALVDLYSSANGELFSFTRLKNMALVMKMDIAVNNADVQYLRDMFFEFDDATWRQYMYKNRHIMFLPYADMTHNHKGGIVVG